MDKLDMFQYRFFFNGRIRLVGFGKNFIRCRYTIYLHRVQGRISNPQCKSYVSNSRASGNEQRSKNNTENVAYDFKLTYGTCVSFGILYSLCINAYSGSYFPSTNNQRLDKRIRQANHPI